ncbi:hypothetical protein [Solimonas soli]|uniref:hypothetical protein n=1 Tax=Solimonas soli TaxID=413479 RepID=UPI0004B66EFE|nr:hypothetical protein [Solimonas soli]
MLLAMLVTVAIYWSGLYGGFLFDDYPNIIENTAVQPERLGAAELVRAALSSPASEFRRPLASLSFAINYLTGGLDPFWMKLTNLLIHLVNGILFYRLSQRLLSRCGTRDAGRVAALIAASWLVLPINLTAVLYVVQRMESLANLFVLLGLIGYVAGREQMLRDKRAGGFLLSVFSVIAGTLLGLTAKETAILLPLYAALIECFVYGFRGANGRHDARLSVLFTLILALPFALGFAWQLRIVLNPAAWASRPFTLDERLLSEARIVVDYIGWTLLPMPGALSFYHDDFVISRGVLQPWTTAASLVALLALSAGCVAMRKRWPLAALGIALYLGAHTLTATILPLELIYEHRNYFASFGLLLTLVPLLMAGGPMSVARRALLSGLLLLWTMLTAITAYAWGEPLRLAREYAARAPDSPRAQYDLGRTYVVLSQYQSDSPFAALAYEPLERAAALPGSTSLPEQALIMMNARMGRPIDERWWDSLSAKLAARTPGAQDDSAMGALTKCAREGLCALPPQRMVDAFLAALSHGQPSARMLSAYGDYAWNILDDRRLAEQLARDAVAAAPRETIYRITLIRMLLAQGKVDESREQLDALEALNTQGRLDRDIIELQSLFPADAHAG